MSAKVLVVDDDEAILDAVSLVLEEAGNEVLTISKGENTFKQAEIFKPDLILLDILMSGKDGRDICRKLKKNDALKEIPVVMMSAHPSVKLSSIKSGAAELLPKPFDLADLLKLVVKYSPK